ncbi:Uncharacterized protein SCF082_LOCUS8179 [Durusdinium trenchii]|uniref:Uncharacterized protein n=1 Tax=Durusdinium trenchii TaxID=1381693 RepID=A0ABP0ISF5_9DINO
MTFPPDNIVRRGSKEEEQHALPKHGFLQLFEFGPEQLRAMEKEVLRNEGGNHWRADNRLLRAPTQGLSFRTSKDLGDKAEGYMSVIAACGLEWPTPDFPSAKGRPGVGISPFDAAARVPETLGRLRGGTETLGDREVTDRDEVISHQLTSAPLCIVAGHWIDSLDGKSLGWVVSDNKKFWKLSDGKVWCWIPMLKSNSDAFGALWGSVVAEEAQGWRLDTGHVAKKASENVQWRWDDVYTIELELEGLSDLPPPEDTAEARRSTHAVLLHIFQWLSLRSALRASAGTRRWAAGAKAALPVELPPPQVDALLEFCLLQVLQAFDETRLPLPMTAVYAEMRAAGRKALDVKTSGHRSLERMARHFHNLTLVEVTKQRWHKRIHHSPNTRTCVELLLTGVNRSHPLFLEHEVRKGRFACSRCRVGRRFGAAVRVPPTSNERILTCPMTR